MSKFWKSIGRFIYRLIEAIYRFIDKFIVMPISRLVYNIKKSSKGGNNSFNKLLNQPKFLIIISLIFAVLVFLLIDNKVISIIENEAETIKNVPVKVIYNEEAFVVENVPKTIDITITGKKSDIYLAKQLGEFSVELDLSKYTEEGTHKVYFTYSKSIDSVKYILDPSYLVVTIKDRVSEEHSVTYDLVNVDELSGKLSVDSVSLNKTEVVVKGSKDNLAKIASIKALVSVSGDNYNDAGTYELIDIPLIAYDKNGKILKNISIVPGTLTGSIVLKSYKLSVPLSVSTTGKLANGKAISSININKSPSFTLDIYGEESDIKDITSVPITINVDGAGTDSVKKYNLTISKPSGVRYMSASDVEVSVTFGDEKQKTVDIFDIEKKNLASGYNANIISDANISVQVKGVESNIEKIEASNIKAYVDLANLGEGTHEVEVNIDNNNPLVNYVVNKTITIKITKD